MAKNDQIQFSDKWRENRVVIVWNNSLSVDIIAAAPSDNGFVDKSGGGIKKSPMKW